MTRCGELTLVRAAALRGPLAHGLSIAQHSAVRHLCRVASADNLCAMATFDHLRVFKNLLSLFDVVILLLSELMIMLCDVMVVQQPLRTPAASDRLSSNARART